MLDVFITTVDLVDVVDAGSAFGTHGRDEHGYTGSDIGTGHGVMLELALMVMTNYDRTVGIAEDDLRAHIDQLVHEEKARFESSDG